MAEHSDPYGTRGVWDLDQFESKIEQWRADEHPPASVFEQVNQWWRCLEYPDERASSELVERVNDEQSAPDETDIWMLWVPDSYILDEQGLRRVQCFFRLHELEKQPRLECEAFHTAAWRSQTDVDLADGMG